MDFAVAFSVMPARIGETPAPWKLADLAVGGVGAGGGRESPWKLTDLIDLTDDE